MLGQKELEKKPTGKRVESVRTGKYIPTRRLAGFPGDLEIVKKIHYRGDHTDHPHGESR